ncbi:MAG: AAA family ATPase [Bacteroidales bacterium]|nr:AAA family ATPase [Bacteroidales bacterium]MBR4271360.1 AAA family ATPase [Bacteroidales bacterium]
MKIKNLKLKNVGPFREAELDFPQERDANGKLPVTIITGENGTGKSVIIDAIRLLLNYNSRIGRDIVPDHNDFRMEMTVEDNGDKALLAVKNKDAIIEKNRTYYSIFNNSVIEGFKFASWVIDYWNSNLGSDSFKINNLSSIDIKKAYYGALDGVSSNVELTNFICSVDYLRNSDDKQEAEVGNFVYSLIKEIFKECLVDGEFVSVRRQTLSPIVKVKDAEVTLDKLSSGNLLLIERLIGLIRRMYSVCMLNNRPVSEMTLIEGILLIDEVENHLHPQWQRRIVSILQCLFPNLQIIMTTHSPFVVSSVENAKIYVCESKIDYSIVRDMTEDYSNLPVDEVLVSDVFGVSPFATKISDIQEQRKAAIESGNTAKAKELGEQLAKMNSNYFGFINLKESLNCMENEAH